MSGVKRKRVKVDEFKEIEASEKQVYTSAKERAKLHRERKKKYYQELESENSSLKEKIKFLEQRIADFEANSTLLKAPPQPLNLVNDGLTEKSLSSLTNSQNAKIEKLQMENDYALRTLPRMYKQDKQKVSYTSMEQTKETRGALGTERVRLLRELFNSFLKNILPVENKATLYLFDNIPLTR